MSNFSTATLVSSLISKSTTLTGLTAGQTYYWRARSIDTAPDTSDWSTIELFTVFAGLSAETPPTLPVVPQLGSPINEVEVPTSGPVFSWFAPAYTQAIMTYELQYSLNEAFSNSVIVNDLDSPDYEASG